jgi:hypothetical protein
MRTGHVLTVVCLLTLPVVACAPHQIQPVADIDPSPLLETVTYRQTAFESGVSGTLEMDFKQGKKHFRGSVFIVAFPDGRFRLEVPGPLGNTLLIMANNGHEVLAYYPEKGKAYRSVSDGPSLNPHLPFPLPVEANTLTPLLLGIIPEGMSISQLNAFLLQSGEKQLLAGSNNGGLQLTYLFTREPSVALRIVKASKKDMDIVVTTQKTPPYFPEGFVLATPDANLKGEWEKVAFFDGDETILQLNVPASVHVTDLEGYP